MFSFIGRWGRFDIRDSATGVTNMYIWSYTCMRPVLDILMGAHPKENIRYYSVVYKITCSLARKCIPVAVCRQEGDPGEAQKGSGSLSWIFLFQDTRNIVYKSVDIWYILLSDWHGGRYVHLQQIFFLHSNFMWYFPWDISLRGIYVQQTICTCRGLYSLIMIIASVHIS